MLSAEHDAVGISGPYRELPISGYCHSLRT
jgi:hypothetical protein